MNAKYIYSANTVKAMEVDLLSDTQLERLLSAKSVEEAYHSLSDTFLSPYVASKSQAELPKLLRQSLIDTKEYLESIEPEKGMMDILWLRYDFYNLKTIIKGEKAGLSDEEILENCYDIGTVVPSEMLRIVREDNFNILELEFGDTYKDAVKQDTVYSIDIAINKGYFRTIKRIATTSNNSFLNTFATLLIDLFNIKTQLRMSSLGELDINFFIDGGSVRKESLDTKDKIFDALKGFGGEALWKDAIAQYQELGHYTLLEKTADDG